MSGPTGKYVYTDDDGNTWAVRLPQWQANFSNHAGTITQAPVAATTQDEKPKGLRLRYRFATQTSDSHRVKFTVLNPSNGISLAAIGTGVVIDRFDVAPPSADNGTLGGKVGEKLRAI